MAFQLCIGQAGFCVMLHPFHASGGQIRRGSEAGHVWQDFPRNIGDFEGKGGRIIGPAADRKELAADFPDVRIAPLYDMGGGFERAAKGVVFFACHEVSVLLCIGMAGGWC